MIFRSQSILCQRGTEKKFQLLKKSNLETNITGGSQYVGPNPPIGHHEYYFRIYALSKSTLILYNANKASVMEAMKGSILAYGELIGKF